MRRVMSNAPRQTAAQGFTLVEVLVGLGIMALLSVLTAQGLDLLLRSRDTARADIDRVALMQVSLRQWQWDLDASQTLTEALPEGSVSWNGRVMRMARPVGWTATDGADGGMQVVAWTVREGHWWRWQSAPLFTRLQVQHAWRSALQWGQQPWHAQEPLATQLAAADDWQLQFHANHAWFPTPTAAGTPQTPTGIRLVLTLPHATTDAVPPTLTVDWVHPAFNPQRS